jgi:hypothetical protein
MIQSGGVISDTLRSVDVPIVSDDVCNRAYGGTTANPEVLPSMLCAGDISNGKFTVFHKFNEKTLKLIPS